MKRIIIATAAAAWVLASPGAANAADAAPKRSAKDVVLAPLTQPTAYLPDGSVAPATTNQDGMAVSVLVETPQGVLIPHSTALPFQTGQRFRLKILTPRDGDILIYNTNPLGQTNPEPVWKASVRGGLETVTPALQLVGNRGEDLLHVVLQPQSVAPQGTFAWFENLFASKGTKGTKTSKDVRLVTENTPQATYVYNAAGQGGLVTVRIRHQ